MMDSSDDSHTPSPKGTTPRPENVVKFTLSSNIDPALSGISSPGARSESGDSAKDRAEEAWIENIRVIEALRELIKDRLRRKEYDEEENEDTDMSGTAVAKSSPERSSESLYPVLRSDE
jgi:hypothetical protein